jgi:hypothetical protein
VTTEALRPQAPRRRPRLGRWGRPGWYRALLSQPLGFLLAVGIVVPVRAAYGYEPLWDWEAIGTVAMISMPLTFLVGIGCFDYWFRWAAGAPTEPEDHSGHGAHRGGTTSRSTPTTRSSGSSTSSRRSSSS